MNATSVHYSVHPHPAPLLKEEIKKNIEKHFKDKGIFVDEILVDNKTIKVSCKENIVKELKNENNFEIEVTTDNKFLVCLEVESNEDIEGKLSFEEMAVTPKDIQYQSKKLGSLYQYEVCLMFESKENAESLMEKYKENEDEMIGDFVVMIRKKELKEIGNTKFKLNLLGNDKESNEPENGIFSWESSELNATTTTTTTGTTTFATTTVATSPINDTLNLETEDSLRKSIEIRHEEIKRVQEKKRKEEEENRKRKEELERKREKEKKEQIKKYREEIARLREEEGELVKENENIEKLVILEYKNLLKLEEEKQSTMASMIKALK